MSVPITYITVESINQVKDVLPEICSKFKNIRYIQVLSGGVNLSSNNVLITLEFDEYSSNHIQIWYDSNTGKFTYYDIQMVSVDTSIDNADVWNLQELMEQLHSWKYTVKKQKVLKVLNYMLEANDEI